MVCAALFKNIGFALLFTFALLIGFLHKKSVFLGISCAAKPKI